MKYYIDSDREYEDFPIPDNGDIYGVGASAYDCTGLIPTPPQTEDEYEAYDEIYPYLPDDNEQ